MINLEPIEYIDIAVNDPGEVPKKGAYHTIFKSASGLVESWTVDGTYHRLDGAAFLCYSELHGEWARQYRVNGILFLTENEYQKGVEDYICQIIKDQVI